mgnify:CR=1 FL=1
MSNRLAAETSPYLLQHADNPVDWHAWGEEALALARAQDRPILLSIGYSACHWCHVMAHESFEDPATAAVMNAHFVNIKVDREERPDLDQIYQSAHAILSRRSGGWPLTMFLTPQQIPVYSGTYFPPAPRHGLPGFADLLQQIAGVWRERRPEIEAQNASVLAALESIAPRAEPGELDGALVTAAVEHLGAMFDPLHGGFGQAPKFPNPADLALLLRRAACGDDQARHMALLTLRKMAEGGIYDQLGGGFSRYSVDERWEIPHFEKMLYDNAQLLVLYSDAWQMTGEARYAQVLDETVAWSLREMRIEEGAFCSSLAADSEGEEGRFYVWQRDELRQCLSAHEYALLEHGYGLDQSPNFEHAWHLHVTRDAETVAQRLGVDAAVLPGLWISTRAKLMQARAARVRPGRDDKLLTSWNALMIAGLARAGRARGNADWVAAAQASSDFIRRQLWRDGCLLATCKDGKAHLNAYLDDHAFLLSAQLELLQADFRRVDLDFAIELAEALLARFEDPAGGFFLTSHDHETLIQRPKPVYDNATPSGNGIAAYALQRLGHLLGEARYLAAAERTLRAFAAAMQRNPAACPSLLLALGEYLMPPAVLLLRGPQAETEDWKRAVDRLWLPAVMSIALPEQAGSLPQALERPVKNNVNAWLCMGVECLPVIESLQVLIETILSLGKRGKTQL